MGPGSGRQITPRRSPRTATAKRCASQFHSFSSGSWCRGKRDTNKQRDASSYDEVTGDFDRFTERYTSAIASRVVECAR